MEYGILVWHQKAIEVSFDSEVMKGVNWAGLAEETDV